MLTIQSTRIKINPIPVHYKSLLTFKIFPENNYSSNKINGLGKNKH